MIKDKFRIKTKTKIKIKTKNKKRTVKRRTRKHHRMMKGGGYTQEQIQNLLDLGFTSFFIKLASGGKIGYNRLINSFHSSNKPVNEYMKGVYTELGINPDDELTDYETSDDEQMGGKKRHKKY